MIAFWCHKAVEAYRTDSSIAVNLYVDEHTGLGPAETFSLNELDSSPVCGTQMPEVANATWAYAARDGSVVTYSCNVGYHTRAGGASFNYSCVPGEAVTEDKLPDTCMITQCQRPSRLENAEMIWPGGAHVLTGDFGSIVDFRCARGFSGDGEVHGPKVVKMFCSQGGAYEFVLNTITSCKLIHCSTPLNMRNAALPSTTDKMAVVMYDQSVDYSCSEGFVVSTNASLTNFTLRCNDDGEFVPNDPMPRCVESTCPEPPLLEHASTIQVSGEVSADDRVIYRCDNGFFVSEIPASSTFNIRCEFLGGRAQYVLPPAEDRCKALPCLALPELVNARVESSNNVWRYLDSVPFSCVPGYTLGGEKGKNEFDGSCNSQGMWTINDQPKCEKVVCDEVPADMLKYARLVPFGSAPINYGMNTTVECTNGAVVTYSAGTETSFDLECGESGEYTSTGICAIPCPVIPKVSFSTSPSFGKILQFGDGPVTITCKEGYMTSTGDRAQRIACNRDGTLTHISDCTPIPGYSGGQAAAYNEHPDIWGYQDSTALSDGMFLRKSSEFTVSIHVAILTIVLMVVY